MALLPLLVLFAMPVRAADLHVTFTGPGGGPPMHMIFQDVKPGVLPRFVVAGPGGTDLLVRIDFGFPPVTEGGCKATVFDTEIKEIKAKGTKGKLLTKILSRPQITTCVGTAASIHQGARIPIPGASPTEYREEAIALEMLYDDGTAPPAAK